MHRRGGGSFTGWGDIFAWFGRLHCVGECVVFFLFPSLSYLIWAGELQSNVLGVLVRPPPDPGRPNRGVANFPRICIQGPLGSTTIWPARIPGIGAVDRERRPSFLTQERCVCVCHCTRTLTREHPHQPNRSEGGPCQMTRRSRLCSRTKSIHHICSSCVRMTPCLSQSEGLGDPTSVRRSQ